MAYSSAQDIVNSFGSIPGVTARGSSAGTAHVSVPGRGATADSIVQSFNFLKIPTPHSAMLADSRANEQAQITPALLAQRQARMAKAQKNMPNLQAADQAVAKNTTGSFMHNLKVLGPMNTAQAVGQVHDRILPDLKNLVVGGARMTARAPETLSLGLQPNNTAQAPAHQGPAAPQTLGIKSLQKPNPDKAMKKTPAVINATNPLTKTLFGSEPITSPQAMGAGAQASHPGGFQVGPLHLSPSQTGITEATGAAALSAAALQGGISGGIKASAKAGAVKAAVKETAATTKNTATRALIAHGDEATTPSKVNTIVNKSKGIQATSDSLKGPTTKLLPEGKPTPTPVKPAAEGPGFTMHHVANPTAVAAGKRVAQINKSLSDISSGKSSASGTEVRSLMQEKQQLGETVRNTVNLHDVPVGEAPKAEATPVATQAKPVAEPTTKPLAPGVSSPTAKPAEVIGGEGPPTVVGKSVGGEAAPGPEEVKVPSSQLPVGAGKEKVSRLEQRMQTTLNNVAPEDQSKISHFNEMNIEENKAKAAAFVEKDPQGAMDVMLGKKNPPAGIAHNAVWLALDNKAVGDPQLALKLTSLRATRGGQEMRLLSEANPYSPTKHLTELRDIRISKAGGRKAIQREVSGIKDTIAKTTKAPSRSDWSDFVESLKC